MTSKTMLILAFAGMLSFGAGCKKDEPAATDTPPPPPQSTDTSAAAPAQGDVATCPSTLVPQGGTVRLLQSFNVFQGLDVSSKKLTGLSVGTLINLKGSCGNWMLIEWPSGVGQLSLGWIELRTNDTRVTKADPVDAGAPPVDAAAPVDAGGPPDAGKSDAGPGRLLIKPPREGDKTKKP